MEVAFLFFGMAIGICIGMQYHKYQIIKKKNPKIIEEVKNWLKEVD